MSYSPDLIGTALKMIASLGIVLGGMFVIFYFFKRIMNKNISGTGGKKLVNIISNTYIGVKKSISLVEVPGALLVLGITNDNISLLAKIEDNEIIKNFNLDNENRFQTTFSDQLHRLSDKLKKRDQNPQG